MISLNPESHLLDVRIESDAFEGPGLVQFQDEIARLPYCEIRAVRVNFESVNRIDSTGLNALIDLRRRVDSKAEFMLENVAPNVWKVISLLGAGSMFDLQSAT